MRRNGKTSLIRHRAREALLSRRHMTHTGSKHSEKLNPLRSIIGKFALGPTSVREFGPTASLNDRFCADCVEEVCELAMLDPTMRPAHGCLIVPKRAGAQGSGSALRASGGSGPWQQGGTRLEHPTGLLA